VTGLLQFFSTGINGTYVVPEMIVVAIPNTDRTRDLTPTSAATGADGKPTAAFKTSGGGPSFLRFIKNELIPHIDSAYRTEPYRMLVGHSFGGITTISALYTMPEVFNTYVAIDPSLWWDNQTLLKQAKDYFSKPAPIGRTLFVGQANTLQPGDTSVNVHFRSIGEFNKLLESSNKSGIRYSYKYYGGDDHGSVPLIAEYDALRFIFDDYKLDTRKALERPAFVAEHFAKVSARMGYTVLPPERIVDRLGGDPMKTVAFMQLNVDNYPKSPHAFFSLGNALLAAHDTAKARSALERSLALDPANPRVKDLLAKLSAK
jgi:predicted alpha/beta superfamily hydrolase